MTVMISLGEAGSVEGRYGQAVKKYLDIDEKGIDMNLERRNRSVALVATFRSRAHKGQ